MTGRGVVVREAVGSDLPAIAEIEAATFSRPWSRATFTGLLGRSEAQLLVASDGGSVVGYLVLLTGPGEAELANLAVSTGSRKRGIGKALLAAASEILLDKGIGCLYLAVRASNEKAIRLYERFGFSDVGTHRAYYQDPSEDARVLALELSGSTPSRGSSS
ncbi:MAG: ribosomal protein S18-alanine N-acetyltransferase [Gemmatimonadota bacterium]|nr:ribosomal protein S18-alanine N-acetyltransferase [Gemmatimonadota bacterium]MDE2864036.1 ribosomal protein S18-alanine N-acetyltransferase [Gemmatimonadota bacterium]